MRKAEATTYRPFLDYGGYGVRLGFRGWAFNVSGNEGVLVETNDGSHLMIGSQRPKELEAAVARARATDKAPSGRSPWFQRRGGTRVPHQRRGSGFVAGYFLGLDADERPKLNARYE